ncbi:DUF294 nucleotidyltransferase-like domain-containing protein [Coraliomargarita parva]|uniref:DUF294 nucleotidyltransferase-like domain-containing protein n=1 Tax=Coraliomargarita parva TaxID=3014050 RepID=UPI0022B46F2C|nr:DUF294 nucleotidyltransferase-like domain-containing protein [Coraliomargarita parva]
MRSKTNNAIPDRIARAIKQYPPFSLLPDDAVPSLAAQASVIALAVGEKLWQQGDPPLDRLYFLSTGRIEYYWENKGVTERVDVRDIGDLLGLTSLLEGEPHKVHAVVEEDSLLYVIPGKPFKELLDAHDEARHYVRRHMFWSTRVGAKVQIPEKAQMAAKHTILESHLEGAQYLNTRPIERLVTCTPDSPIYRAAQLMVNKRLPSVLVVDRMRRPLGIVTSLQLIRHIIINRSSPDAPVNDIMAKPVYTVSPNSSTTAALLLMLRERIPQICVTEDGTSATKALDVCTHKDLLAQSGHHPAGILREIRNARSTARLRELCDEIEGLMRRYATNAISGIFLGQICGELYDELTQRLVGMAAEHMADHERRFPAVPWAWLSVGSDGRREQILRTDMDNALVYAESGNAKQDAANRQFFLDFSNHVIELMTECGFTRCQGGVMASNPNWCQSESTWLNEIRTPTWSDENTLLRSVILFDLRYVSGSKELTQRVRDAVFDQVENDVRLQRKLAELTLAVPPPLNFRGKYIVEKKGMHAGLFDLKKRALSPLRDAARALAFKYRLTRHYSTGGRYEQIKEAVPELEETAELAYEAYDFLLRLRLLNGLKRGDDGRYIDPAELTRLERAHLSNVFDVLRMVQGQLRSEFSL